MCKLLPKTLEDILPMPGEQEANNDPTVYAVFYFSLCGWTWFVTEGESVEGDFLFYGFVAGLEREWGHFCLSELESVDIHGIKICRVEDHKAKPLSDCLKQYGLEEN